MQFKWDKFLPTLEKDFSDILNEALICKNKQQHIPISNINSSMSNKNRNQYNVVRVNTTRMLTNVSPSATNTNEVCGYECISHSIPENNTYGGNDHSSHCTY